MDASCSCRAARLTQAASHLRRHARHAAAPEGHREPLPGPHRRPRGGARGGPAHGVGGVRGDLGQLDVPPRGAGGRRADPGAVLPGLRQRPDGADGRGAGPRRDDLGPAADAGGPGAERAGRRRGGDADQDPAADQPPQPAGGRLPAGPLRGAGALGPGAGGARGLGRDLRQQRLRGGGGVPVGDLHGAGAAEGVRGGGGGPAGAPSLGIQQGLLRVRSARRVPLLRQPAAARDARQRLVRFPGGAGGRGGCGGD